VNSPGPVFGSRLPSTGPAQWPKRLLRPRPVSAARVRAGAVTARCLGAAIGGGTVAGPVPGPHSEHWQFLGRTLGKGVQSWTHPDGVATAT
jgi:hypothetical protein